MKSANKRLRSKGKERGIKRKISHLEDPSKGGGDGGYTSYSLLVNWVMLKLKKIRIKRTITNKIMMNSMLMKTKRATSNKKTTMLT